MKNSFKTAAWVCGAIAGFMMLMGIIAAMAGGVFLNHRWDSYYYPAYNFLLLGVFLLVAYIADKNDKK